MANNCKSLVSCCYSHAFNNISWLSACRLWQTTVNVCNIQFAQALMNPQSNEEYTIITQGMSLALR